MKMPFVQENEIKALLKKKCSPDQLPDMCWVNPLGIICLFLNGRVVNTPEIAWQIFKEERASRTSTIMEFREWLHSLPSPNVILIRGILSACLKKDVSAAEMGRMVENRPSEWDTVKRSDDSCLENKNNCTVILGQMEKMS